MNNTQFTLVEMTDSNECNETSINLELLTPPAPRGKQISNVLLTPSPPRKKSIQRTVRSNISTDIFSPPPPSPIFRNNKSVKLPSPKPNESRTKKKLPTTPRPKTLKDTPINNNNNLLDRIKNTCLSYFK